MFLAIGPANFMLTAQKPARNGCSQSVCEINTTSLISLPNTLSEQPQAIFSP